MSTYKPVQEKSPLDIAIVAITLGVLVFGVVLRFQWFRYFPLYSDSAFYVFLMVNFIENNQLSATVLRLPSNIPLTPYWGYLTVFYGLWGKVFGAGLVQARSLNFVVGILMLPLIFLAAREWFDTKTALISTAVVSILNWHLITVVARNNAIVSLVIAGGLLLHIYATRRQLPPRFHFLVGLYTWLMLEAHVLTIAFAIGLGGYYLYLYGRSVYETGRIFRDSSLWWFVLGCLVAISSYFLLRIAVYGLGNSLAFTQALPDTGIGLLSNTILVRVLITGPYQVDAILFFTILILSLIRRKAQDIQWLIILLFLNIGYFIFDDTGYIHYAVFATPLYFLTLGSFVTYGLQKKTHLKVGWQLVLFTCLAVPLIYSGIQNVQHYEARTELDQQDRAEELEVLEEYAPQGTSVVADKFYAGLLPQNRLIVSGTNTLRFAAATKGLNPAEFWMQELITDWPQVFYAWPNLTFRENGDGDLLATFAHVNEAEAVHPQVTVAETTHFVRNTGVLVPNPDLPLQMVAFEPVTPESGSIETIWVIRTAGEVMAPFVVRVLDDTGQILVETRAASNEASTSEAKDWEPYTFHRLEVPRESFGDVDITAYTVEVEIEDAERCPTRCLYLLE